MTVTDSTSSLIPENQPDELYAAIDLGSNSFHMIITRQTLGTSQVVDKHKEMVRLRAGLDQDGYLTEEAFQNGIACLERFGERLNGIPSKNIRAVGTNTLRNAKNSRAFLKQARKALGCHIQIIAGQEEARLIYLGVAHGLPQNDEQRLVMDIGGGSTEFIIGQRDQHSHLTSTEMGCVSISQDFFGEGQITEKAFRKAIAHCRRILHPHRQQLRRKGWDCAIGASGTIKSIGQILFENQWTQGELTLDGLQKIQALMTEQACVESMQIPGLKEERRPVIVGGLAILIATFLELKIQEMQVSSNALREGLIFDNIGRHYDKDSREISVAAMQKWMKVDEQQASCVSQTAQHLFVQADDIWKLSDQDPEISKLLRWSAQLHECGIAISYKQYRQHGAYIVSNSDMEGFHQQEKYIIASLIQNHRGSINLSVYDEIDQYDSELLITLTVILRLAVRIHRGRDFEPVLPRIKINQHELKLKFEPDWLDLHPLTADDLKTEAKKLANIGYHLSYQ
jgi:exopolyphosphatase/guanosine-5'-triphosphate,3'-diphosphate pyrophosphatase